MTTDHYIFSASGSPRWIPCPGSIEAIRLDRLSGKLPEVDGSSDAADLGTAAHKLGEKCLVKNHKPEKYMAKFIDRFQVDEDMIAAVSVYLKYAADKKKEYGENCIMKIEVKSSLKKILGVNCGGTSDLVFIAIEHGILHIIDYKNGSGILVEVIDNTQLRLYALGVYHGLPKRIKNKIKHVNMTIVQPRAYHDVGPVRSDTKSIKQLLEWQVSTLVPAVQSAESGEIELHASIKACEWCPRAGYCEEAASHKMELAQLEFSDFSDEANLPTPGELPLERIQQIIDHKDVIVKWLNSVWQHAETLQDKKPTFKGWKLVTSISNRRYKSEKKVITTMKKLGLPMTKMFEEAKLKSPTELQKAVQVKMNLTATEAKAVVDKLCERVETGTKMVKETTTGSAVASDAENDFKKLAKPKPRKQKNGQKSKSKKPKLRRKR